MPAVARTRARRGMARRWLHHRPDRSRRTGRRSADGDRCVLLTVARPARRQRFPGWLRRRGRWRC